LRIASASHLFEVAWLFRIVRAARPSLAEQKERVVDPARAG
jgi:hypothetical protein